MSGNGYVRFEPFSYRNDPKVPRFPDDHSVFMFDGHCVLCSRSIDIILRYDRMKRFRLLPAQSALAHALYIHYGLDPEHLQTNVLLIAGRALFKSEGSIRLAMGLGFPWRLAVVFRLLPRRLADAFYEWVAKNRCRSMGCCSTCYLPRAVDRDRFIA